MIKTEKSDVEKEGKSDDSKVDFSEIMVCVCDGDDVETYLCVYPSITVEDLKKEYCEKREMPLDSIALIFRDRLLNNKV